MPHGQPDWGPVAPTKTVYKLQDMAELAARLGSINTYDRRGETIWMDDFEDNIAKWRISTAGTGASITLSTDEARNGAKSAKLVAGSDGAHMAQMYKYFTYPVLSKIGLEVSISRKANVKDFILNLNIFDGTYKHAAEIMITTATNQVDYLDKYGSFQKLTTIPPFSGSDSDFQTIKFVVDFVNEKYAYFKIFGVEHDMSSYAYWKDPSSTQNRAWARILNTGDAGANGIIYVDDVIITQNEP